MNILLDQRILSNDGIGRFSYNLVNKLLENKSYSNNKYFVISRDKSDCSTYYYDTSQRYTWQELINLNKAIKHFHIDLIHCFDYKVPYPAVNIPVIVSIHDIFRYTDPSQCYDDNFFISKYGIDCYNDICDIVNCLSKDLSKYNIEIHKKDCIYMHYKYYRLLLMWAIISSSKIIVPSNTVKEEILKNFIIESEKIEVINYGIDHCGLKQINIQPSDHLQRKPKFIYVGQNRKHKNVKIILEAMMFFIRKHPEYYLELIGSDFQENQREFWDEYNLANHLKLLGYVSDQEIRKKYCDSIALIHVSSYEGYGFTPLEAMSFGCPVITGKTPIAQEVLGKYPVYVENISCVEELICAMEFVIDHQHYFNNEARQFALSHTWDKFVCSLLRVYEEFIII